MWKEARLSLAYPQGSIEKIYAATLGSTDEAGKCLHCCIKRSGGDDTTKLHCVADGAQWIQEQIERLFGDQANLLIDFYHVSQYLAKAIECLAPQNPDEWLKSSQSLLKNGKLEKVLNPLRRYVEDHSTANKDCPVKTCLNYLERRTLFLDYRSAIEQNLPIGSGAIESGNRHIIQDRLKLAGAWWKKENAQAVLDLRTVRANGDWNLYWSGGLA